MTITTLRRPTGMKSYPSLPNDPPSVTSILDLTWPSPELDRWKLSQAASKGKDWDDRSAARRTFSLASI